MLTLFLVIGIEPEPPTFPPDPPTLPDDETDAPPLDDEACGIFQPMIISESSTGEITSPGHPFSYPDDSDCQWQISVDEGFVVELTFIDFNVEEG